jgi:hypothetical protein
VRCEVSDKWSNTIIIRNFQSISPFGSQINFPEQYFPNNIFRTIFSEYYFPGPTSIGSNGYIQAQCRIGAGSQLGERIVFAQGVELGEGVELQDGVGLFVLI